MKKKYLVSFFVLSLFTYAATQNNSFLLSTAGAESEVAKMEESLGTQTYANLREAVSAVGESRKHLTLSVPTICDTPMTVPQNVTLVFTDEGKVVRSGTCALTVDGEILASRIQIFQGFTPDTLRLRGALERVYPEWFGARGDTVVKGGTPLGTDDYDAIQMMFDAVESSDNNDTTTQSATFSFAAKGYRSSQTISVRKSSYIKGAGGGTIFVSTKIYFDAGVTGFLFHNAISETGKEINTTSDGSRFERIGLIGAGANHTHVVNTTGLKVRRTAGENFNVEKDYGRGQIFNIGGVPFIIADNAATTDTLSILPFRFSGNVPSGALNRVEIGGTSAFWVGGTVTIDTGETRVIMSQNTDGVTVSAPFPASFQGDVTFTPANKTGTPATIGKFHGIDAKSRIDSEACYITGFAGNGINIDSHTPNVPNSNYTKLTWNRVSDNRGHGIFFVGINSNAGKIDTNDSTDNDGYGYYDISFLGNNYFANHANSNSQGHYFSRNGGVNFSNFYGNYGEQGSPTNFIGQYGLWIGGNPGNGFDKNSEGSYIGGASNGAMDVTALRVTNNPNNYGGIGAPRMPNVTAVFGSTNSPYPRILWMHGNDDTSGGYQIDYGNGTPGDGWYALRNETFHRTQQYNTVLAWSGSRAAEGRAKLWMPQGVYIGKGDARGFLSAIKPYAASITPARVVANSTSEQKFTVAGLAVGDRVVLNAPAQPAGLFVSNTRVSDPDTLAVTFANITGAPLTPTGGNYPLTIIRH